MQLRVRYKLKHLPSKEEYVTEFFYEDEREALRSEEKLQAFIMKYVNAAIDHRILFLAKDFQWEEVNEPR